MHCEKMRVKTYQKGYREPTKHSFNSIKELGEMLNDLEDEDTKNNTIYQVDVSLPFSKIKVKMNQFYNHWHQENQQNEFL